VKNSTDEPNTGSRSKGLITFFEHGEMPDDVAEGVQSAITAIKTQPKKVAERFRKPRKNGKSSKSG